MRMTNFAVSTKSPIHSNALSPPVSLHRARYSDPTRSAFRTIQSSAVLADRKFQVSNCRGIEVSSGANRSRGFSASNCSNLCSKFFSRNFDIATLGNLCADIVLDVPFLPPASLPERKAYMEQLAASPPDKCAFSWMSSLNEEVKKTIQRSKILFVNGHGFDELSPGLIVSTVNYATSVGTCVFFDPGPRGKSLSTGTAEQKMARSAFLKRSDVLLLTSNEV